MSKRRPSYRQGQGQDHDSKGDNSQGRNEERPRERRRNGSRRGPISRVVRGLSERLGVHRHTIIAGFVLGLVFVPMLTLLVFLGALYWVNDPERIEDKLDHLADKARKSYRSHFGAGRAVGITMTRPRRAERRPVQVPPRDPQMRGRTPRRLPSYPTFPSFVASSKNSKLEPRPSRHVWHQRSSP